MVVINPNKFKIRVYCENYESVRRLANHTWLIKIHCKSYEKVGKSASQAVLPGYLC